MNAFFVLNICLLWLKKHYKIELIKTFYHFFSTKTDFNKYDKI